MLITNVINHVLPLIRYELTDEVTLLDEPNPGPWTGRRITDIEGRSDDIFVYDHVPMSRCERRRRSTPMPSPATSWMGLRRSASERQTFEWLSSKPSAVLEVRGRRDHSYR